MAALLVSVPVGAYAEHCPVTWGLLLVMEIPIRCHLLSFSVFLVRLSRLPTVAVCDRRFLFSMAPPLPCHFALRWLVGFSVRRGRSLRPSISGPTVPLGAGRWQGLGSRVHTHRSPWLLGRRRSVDRQSAFSSLCAPPSAERILVWDSCSPAFAPWRGCRLSRSSGGCCERFLVQGPWAFSWLQLGLPARLPADACRIFVNPERSIPPAEYCRSAV